ncbi:MAG: DUF393 domain-containing protein [Pseudomonadota bacterium]
MRNDPLSAREVYYDGGCPVCRREIALYQGVAALSSVRWTDVSAPDADLAGLDRERALRRFHVRREDGALASGAAAFTAIWRKLPYLRHVARVVDTPPFAQMAEIAYRMFLKVRKLWR